MRWRSILCPVDFSECSREALRYAADIAHRTGGRLSIVYVNAPLLSLAAARALHRRPHVLRLAQTELERFVDASIGAERRPAGSGGQGKPAAGRASLEHVHETAAAAARARARDRTRAGPS